MSEEEYVLYGHPEDSTCREGGRAVHADREEHRRECYMCDEELEREGVQVVSAEFPDPPEYIVDYIEGLGPEERAVFLGMVMKSLRGNWTQVQDRLAIIGEICERGVDDVLSDEFMEAVESKARGQLIKSRVKYKYNDGRTFRGSMDGGYDKLFEQVEEIPSAMREMSTYIPNDMTWDSYKLRKLEEE